MYPHRSSKPLSVIGAVKAGSIPAESTMAENFILDAGEWNGIPF